MCIALFRSNSCIVYLYIKKNEYTRMIKIVESISFVDNSTMCKCPWIKFTLYFVKALTNELCIYRVKFSLL